MAGGGTRSVERIEQDTPVKRIHIFARLLRDNGFLVAQTDIADAITCFAGDKLMDPAHCRRVLQALFCKRPSERARYQEIFDAFWFGRVGRRRKVQRHAAIAPSKIIGHGASHITGGAKGLLDYIEWSSDRSGGGTGVDNCDVSQDAESTRLAGRSHAASRQLADFSRITDYDEREKLLALADRMAARLRYRISRRRKLHVRGQSVHMRATLRRNLATGGLPLTLLRKTRKTPPVHLLFFVDVSGSMDAYSLFFIRFAYAMTGRFRCADTFIFHTQLVHVSSSFRAANPAIMMEKLALISQGWSGGTKIGEAFSAFNSLYAKQFAGARTVAIIMSDGYDTSPTGLLEAEIKRLKARCHKIIWLNPMLGRQTYQPVTDAMASVLPQLDAFLPAHNLRSLLKLEDAIVRA